MTVQPNGSVSSDRSKAVGIGVGVPCGLALFGALALLWRQRSRESRAKRDARAWEAKYAKLIQEKPGDLAGAERYTHELDGGIVYEVVGRTNQG